MSIGGNDRSPTGFLMFFFGKGRGSEVNRLQGCFRNQVVIQKMGCFDSKSSRMLQHPAFYDFFDPSSERVQASALQQKN